jgi:hypothetical protein
LPGYSLEELVGGELDGAVGEDADHLRPVPLVQRQEPLRTHHPHSQQCKSQLALCGGGEIDGMLRIRKNLFRIQKLSDRLLSSKLPVFCAKKEACSKALKLYGRVPN